MNVIGLDGLCNSITMEEFYTSKEENKLRLEHQIPLRTHYLNYPGTSVGVEPTRLDLPNWRQVFPFNWK